LIACFAIANAHAEPPPEPPREFRGAWVASVFNLNWPSRPGLPVAEQQRELRALLDRAVSLRLNAILLQVRPSSDALYQSKLEPWSAFLTGKMGRAPEPLYDPLALAIGEAHARGLELHAWVNPFRALAASGSSMAPNHVSQKHPEWVRRYGTQLFVDPGEPAARAYVISVLLDIVRRYDIDGLHIDDYFYPYPNKDRSPFPDAATYRRYQAAQGKLPLDDWRRDNINQFVETLYRTIKTEKRWVKFGVSPFGIWRPGIPATTEAQLDSYAHLFADSRRWLNEGWCDYFSPQLYWSIEPAAQSFPVLLDWWRGENRLGRHLWPGIAPERIGSKRPASEIARQIALTRAGGKQAPGAVHWEMKSLWQDRGGIGALLREQTYRDPALVPPSPWLGKEPPAPPRVERRGAELAWKAAGDVPARWWAVQTKRAGWALRVLPASETAVPLGQEVEAVAVRAIDRFGNTSAPAVFTR
jgi:uncharacterized lipoprotein YddW (UPF0748 family)